MSDISRQDLIADIAQSLQCPVQEVPGDLRDFQLEKALGYSKGTAAVKRTRGDMPIPSYKAGKTRRTPLAAVIEFKMAQIQQQYLEMEAA
jgi:hypothetical protein